VGRPGGYVRVLAEEVLSVGLVLRVALPDRIAPAFQLRLVAIVGVNAADRIPISSLVDAAGVALGAVLEEPQVEEAAIVPFAPDADLCIQPAGCDVDS